jgi:hypothetical protein
MKARFAIFGLVAAIGSSAFLTSAPVRAQENGALLDALVKKGVLSDQEAEDIRADEEKDYSSTAASKINLSSSIKSVTFYGDLRLRYELRDGSTPAGLTGQNGVASNGGSQDRNAWRYRLRFGFKGDLYDNFFYGVRISTNPTYDRSGNVTLGHSDDAGVFGKGYSGIAIDQVYLGWKPTSDITLEGGQIINPLYTTSLVWDDNLNPTGAAEMYDHTFENGLEVFGTAGQWLLTSAEGNGISNTILGQAGNGANNPSNFNNTFTFAEQVGMKYKFNDDTAFKAAATLYEYTGQDAENSASVAGYYSASPSNYSSGTNSPTFNNGPFVGAAAAPTTNVSGENALEIIEIPMEFDFKGFGVPMRFFSDVAYNIEGQERADDARQALLTGNLGGVTPAGSPGAVTGAPTLAAIQASPTGQGVLHSGKGFEDDLAYQVGYEAGVLKKKGDWQTRLYWQSIGYYALDPNLIDADVFNAATNLQGIVVQGSYNWTDGLTSTLRFAHASRVNNQLATPNVTQDLTLANISSYNLFQADLQWKF